MKTMTFPRFLIAWPVRMTIVSINDRVASARVDYDRRVGDRPGRYSHPEWDQIIDGIVDEAIADTKSLISGNPPYDIMDPECDHTYVCSEALIVIRHRDGYDSIMAVVRYNTYRRGEEDNPDVEVIRFRGLPAIM
jgi:hypothetical protein